MIPIIQVGLFVVLSLACLSCKKPADTSSGIHVGIKTCKLAYKRLMEKVICISIVHTNPIFGPLYIITCMQYMLHFGDYI